jgi:hypothetical protein
LQLGDFHGCPDGRREGRDENQRSSVRAWFSMC